MMAAATATKTADNTAELAQKYLDELGYIKFQMETKVNESLPGGIEARIWHKDWKIEIEYCSNWRELYNESRKAHLDVLKKIGRPVEPKAFGEANDVLYSVVHHEHGHWRYCPYDVEHVEKILDAVSRGLRDAGLDGEKVKMLTPNKAQEFTDIIDNTCLAVYKPDTVPGRATKYLREAYKADLITALLTGQKTNKQPTFGNDGAYSAFVDIQMRLFNKEASDIAEIYTKDYAAKIKPIVDSVLTEFGKPLQLGPALVKGSHSKEDLENLVKYMKDPNSWAELAYKYAKLTAQLGSTDLVELTPFIIEIMTDPNVRAQVIQLALQRGHDPSLYNEPFEVFQQKHRMFGKKIRHDVIVSKGMNAPKPATPYAYMTKTPTKVPKNVAWSKTRTDIHEKSGIVFGQKTNPMVKPSSGSQVGSLADLLFVCDNSGSMSGGKFEALIDTVYAISEDLKAEGKASLIQYALLQFSEPSKTSFTGWHTNTLPLEKALYNSLVSGLGSDTRLPPAMLKAAYSNHPNCTLVGVSDGAIFNYREAIKALTDFKGKIIWFQIKSSYEEVPEFVRLLSSFNNAVVHIIDEARAKYEMPASLLSTTNKLYARPKPGQKTGEGDPSPGNGSGYFT